MKITVVGAGMVGTEVCGLLVSMAVAREIVLIDIDRDKARGEIMDFLHTTSFNSTKNIHMTAGDYEDASGSDVVVITAGRSVRKGETRADLASVNIRLISDIVCELKRCCPDAIIINVTNPVDCVTLHSMKRADWNPSRIISTGTLIDTARFMKILGEYLDIDPKNVTGYVLGEHGQESFIPWSICNILGIDVDTYCEINGMKKPDHDEFLEKVKQSGFDIFNLKGNTSHGIAKTVFRIIRAIELNENSAMPVGIYVDRAFGIEDVVISLPVILNKNGVGRIVNYKFNDSELEALKRAEEHIKGMLPQ